MSENIYEVYLANPITSNSTTDLMYFGQSPYEAGNDSAMLYSNFFKQFGSLSPYIVGENQTYTTIQSAINAAHSTTPTASSPLVVLITAGSYTENLTLYPFVYLSSASESDAVIIKGNATFTTSSSSQIFAANNVTFQSQVSGGTAAFEVAGSNSCSVNLYSCDLIALGGYAYECTNEEAIVNGYNCVLTGNASSATFNITNGSTAFYSVNVNGNNTGSTCSGGELTFIGGSINDAFILTNGATVSCYNPGYIQAPNSQSAFTIGASANVTVTNTVISSTASSTYWATGTGVLVYNNIYATSSAYKIDSGLTTTQIYSANFANLSLDGGETNYSGNGKLMIGSTSGPAKTGTLTAGTGISVTNGANTITVANAGILQGDHNFFLPMGSLYPALTNGASIQQVQSSSNLNNFRGWSFVNGTATYIHTQVAFPSSWDGATLTLIPYFITTATTGNVSFTVQTCLRNNGDEFDYAFSTANTITTSVNGSADYMNIGTETTITLGGSSFSYPSLIEFRIGRSASDTAAAAAILVGLQLKLNITSGTDS